MILPNSAKQHLVFISPAVQLSVTIEARTQDFVDEAAKNGVAPNEALKGLLELGITAATLRMLPAQTNRVIGRWKE